MKDLKKLQRKLIPVNILVIILSLVAAFSIIFCPLITVDLGVVMTELSNVSPEKGDTEEGEGFDFTAILDYTGELKVSLTTYDIAKFAFSPEPMNTLIEGLATTIKAVQKDLVSNVLTKVLPEMIEGIETQIDSIDVNADELIDKLNDVFDAEVAERDQKVTALVNEIQSQIGSNVIDDSAKDSLKETVNQYLEYAEEALSGEELNLESFTCVMISRMMAGEDAEEKSIATSYDELIGNLLNEASQSLEGQQFEVVLNHPIVPIVKYFLYYIFFFAGVWVIQALVALLRIFTKNKRFMMWYTKLFGFFPCLVFGVMPLAAGTIATLIVSEIGPMVGAILGTVSSMTWISGICYLVLWMVSILWAFPIKRKIRKLLRNGATYN